MEHRYETYIEEHPEFLTEPEERKLDGFTPLSVRHGVCLSELC